MPGNTLLTTDEITAEAVRLFKNSNLFIMNMDTQYDPAFAIDGARIGQTLRIRLPNDYVVSDGPALQLQGTNEQYTTLTISSQKHVDMAFSSVERTMSIDDYSEIVISPAMNALAGKVAATVMLASEGGVSNFVSNKDGNNNIISPTMDTYLDANATLTLNSSDSEDRRMVLDPRSNARSVSALAGLLNPTPEISAQFRSGSMKSGLGFGRWFEDNTVIKHTSGTFSAGGTVNGGNQTTASGGGNITVNAITGTLVVGDFVTFAGVNAVNRVTKQSQGTLQQFVVTAAVATGGTTVAIYPGLVPSATGVAGGPDVQYQTVDSSPINGAAMVMLTLASEVYRKSIAYVQKAVTLGTADLILVKNAVVECARAVYDGISIRILTDYITGGDQLATRIDCLFGQRYIRPEWLCVVADRV